jgi:ABC-type proline/glycine betaine transport system ATPase subunit
LATQPKLLILNEPTRGIDVGVKEEVHRIVADLTQEGVSVIIVTSDLDEMLRIVDRVVLFVGAAVVDDRPAASLSKEDVLRIAFSSARTFKSRHRCGTANIACNNCATEALVGLSDKEFWLICTPSAGDEPEIIRYSATTACLFDAEEALPLTPTRLAYQAVREGVTIAVMMTAAATRAVAGAAARA